MLRVKFLALGAKMPEVAHPGSDLGFDIFALEDTVLPLGVAVAVPTGIAAQYVHVETVRPFPNGFTIRHSRSPFASGSMRKFGMLIKDRSSMAAKGIKTSAGVIDSGFTGELKVMMTNHNSEHTHVYCPLYGYDPRLDYPYYQETRFGYLIKAGAKIAQLVPTEVFTVGTIVEVDDLGQTARGTGGFGSSGS